MDYAGNSDKLKKADTPKPEKVVEKVITGEVIQKPKPLGRRIKDVFFGGDARSASRYVTAEVLLPAMRNLLVDAVTKTIERMVYGESRSSRGRAPDYRSNITYNNPFRMTESRSYTHLPDQPRHYPPARGRRESNQMVLVSRGEAERVVERMLDILSKYDVVSVADLNDLLGLPSPHTDNKWGWVSLQGTEIRQVREGFLLDFPNPEPI